VASESILTIGAPSATAADAQPTFAVRAYAMVSDYWALTKPEVNFLIAMATFTGFYLGHATEPQVFPFWLLIHTLLGTLLVARGTGTLNQYIERRFDAQMRRTARRPLPAGRLNAPRALWFICHPEITILNVIPPGWDDSARPPDLVDRQDEGAALTSACAI